MAVRVGFEPTEPVKVQRFSRPPDSTALAPHRLGWSCLCVILAFSWSSLFNEVLSRVTLYFSLARVTQRPRDRPMGDHCNRPRQTAQRFYPAVRAAALRTRLSVRFGK